MPNLAGKKIVVVGGSLGVGRAVVALGRREGADVLAVARSADALATLAAAGVRLIDTQPRVGIRGSRVAFLHPSASGGVLTELVGSRPSG